MDPLYTKKRKIMADTSLLSLPKHLLLSILGRVASSSRHDLHSAKLSCKVLQKIAEDRYIYQRISLDGIPLHEQLLPPLNMKVFEFFNRCLESQNIEAIFRKGYVDFVSAKDIKNAMGLLETASRAGHIVASYTLAIFLIFGGGMDATSMERGITMLSAMKKTDFQRSETNACRKQFKKLFRTGHIWIRNDLLYYERTECCENEDHIRQRHKWHSWPRSDDEDEIFYVVECDLCACDAELLPIYDMLPHIHNIWDL